MFNFIYDPQRRDYFSEHNPSIRATRIDKPGYIYGGGGGTEVVTPQPPAQPSNVGGFKEKSL